MSGSSRGELRNFIAGSIMRSISTQSFFRQLVPAVKVGRFPAREPPRRSTAGEELSFTAAAIVSLALGIGADTAILVRSTYVMLRMMPVHEPERSVQFIKYREPYERGFFSSPISYAFWKRRFGVDPAAFPFPIRSGEPLTKSHVRSATDLASPFRIYLS